MGKIMSSKILNVTEKELVNFGSVWNELLKIKLDILFQISEEKKEDFGKLLEEFLPEALEDEHKYLLSDKYIINKPSEKQVKVNNQKTNEPVEDKLEQKEIKVNNQETNK